MQQGRLLPTARSLTVAERPTQGTDTAHPVPCIKTEGQLHTARRMAEQTKGAGMQSQRTSACCSQHSMKGLSVSLLWSSLHVCVGEDMHGKLMRRCGRAWPLRVSHSDSQDKKCMRLHGTFVLNLTPFMRVLNVDIGPPLPNRGSPMNACMFARGLPKLGFQALATQVMGPSPSRSWISFALLRW
jgi:hypothetical protein